jgi:predicted ester cyclase
MNGYNFTERVRKVLSMAREEAARLRHEYVGTEHILLGLIREGEGVAAAVLQNLSVDLEEIQQRIEETVKQGKASQATGPDLPYTSRAKKVLELAMSEARELGHSYVGTEHLLLGLLREERSVAAIVLNDVGVTLDAARAEVQRLLGPGATLDGRPAAAGRRREGSTADAELVRGTLAAAFAGRLDVLEPHPALHGLRDTLPALFAALPDLSATLEELLVADHGGVASRWLLRGTHLGELYGVAPTGQEVQLQHVSLARVSHGRVVHFAGEAGWLEVLLQLGVLRRGEGR